MNQDISKVENALRDLLALLGRNKYGDNWIELCGLTASKIEKWKGTQENERLRLGQADSRLLYYSEFHDLEDICKKLWEHGVKDVFRTQKELFILLKLLEKYRNATAHSRGLLPFEESLVIGISGKIRNEITRYMSEQNTGDPYYPQFESVQDNLGTTWVSGETRVVFSNKSLRVGDILHLKFTATDPKGEALEYAVAAINGVGKVVEWNVQDVAEIIISEQMVRKVQPISVAVRSSRKYHAQRRQYFNDVDDVITFHYEVFPPDM